MSTYRFGMVGYKFMGRAHSHAYRDIPMFFPDAPRPVLGAIAGRNEAALNAAADVFEVPLRFTDWREMVRSPEVDVVDVAAPGDAHHEIAIAAAEAGKHVICEKPLANTLAQARAMLAAVEKAGVRHGVIFNYRFLPAVQLAQQMIASGRIGRVYHVRAQFLQDWILDPEFPLVWRLKKETAGSGALGDLGAHIIDMARFLVGEFEEVSGAMETFIKERPVPAEEGSLGATGETSGERGEVTVDDAVVFIARLAGAYSGHSRRRASRPGTGAPMRSRSTGAGAACASTSSA